MEDLIVVSASELFELLNCKLLSCFKRSLGLGVSFRFGFDDIGKELTKNSGFDLLVYFPDAVFTRLRFSPLIPFSFYVCGSFSVGGLYCLKEKRNFYGCFGVKNRVIFADKHFLEIASSVDDEAKSFFDFSIYLSPELFMSKLDCSRKGALVYLRDSCNVYYTPTNLTFHFSKSFLFSVFNLFVCSFFGITSTFFNLKSFLGGGSMHIDVSGLDYSCKELKRVLASISEVLGFEFNWNDDEFAFQNLFVFLQSLLDFLGGAK